METNNLFKQDAKTITDTLFETKIFRDDLTRDELNTVEDLIGDLMSFRFKSILRAEKLFKQIENK
ncbi:MAG TPA: hypothetical protein VLA48_03095 [Nitrososphaeraceae archaeon]|nr:hypothetical protein [Nitrososphaeraceae archaeon]